MSMASLSYYSTSNFEANIHQQELNSDMTMLTPEQLLLDFNYDTFPNQETCYFDPFFDINEYLLPVETNCNASFVPEIQDNDFQSYPKRQKVFQDNYQYPRDILTTPPTQGLFNGQFVPNNPPMFQDFSSFSLPEIPLPPVFSSGWCNSAHEVPHVKKGNEKKMSAQSIAARQRRKKITEKTQELGKLIPGGHRMNTAEMLQATFKYIKFLQAQAGLLEFMGSYQENGESFQTTDLHKLVGSSLIQEKLYSSDKCLVPKMFIEALESNNENQHSQGLEVKPSIR